MTTPTALKFGKDANSQNAYAPKPSITKFRALLTGELAAHCQVPVTASLWTVSFRYQAGTSVWVDVTGAAATLPVTATLDATTSELNPASLTLPGGTTISVITANTTADVSVVMWQVNE